MHFFSIIACVVHRALYLNLRATFLLSLNVRKNCVSIFDRNVFMGAATIVYERFLPAASPAFHSVFAKIWSVESWVISLNSNFTHTKQESSLLVASSPNWTNSLVNLTALIYQPKAFERYFQAFGVMIFECDFLNILDWNWTFNLIANFRITTYRANIFICFYPHLSVIFLTCNPLAIQFGCTL